MYLFPSPNSVGPWTQNNDSGLVCKQIPESSQYFFAYACTCVCVGDQGAPGKDGSQGPPGLSGEDGEDGVPGEDGKSLIQVDILF